MKMDAVEALEIALTGRRKARRTGGSFALNPDRCRAAGLEPQAVVNVEAAADRIDAFIEAEKLSLKSQW